MTNIKPLNYRILAIRYLAEYITGNTIEEEDFPEKYNKATELMRMIEIYDSDLSSYSKISKLREICSSLPKLKEKLGSIVNYDNDEILGPYVAKWKEICEFYDRCNKEGITKDIEYLNNISTYFKHYEYARFVVESYISASDSFDTKKFLETLGINRDIFDYCLSVINELDLDLYKKCVNKQEENKKIRIMLTRAKVNEIMCGIKTGFLSDGTPFDEIEFIKRLPFYDTETGREILTDFNISLFAKSDFNIKLRALITKILPKDFETFLRYAHKCRIDNGTVQPFNLKELYATRYFVNGREIKQEETELMLSYMKENNIPMINRGLSIVRDKYLNGQITKKDIKEKKYIPPHKCTLIPGNKN
ncbi:MAG: hypothetical protein J6A52_04595 [Bacilli bacterium]|nr:hypothetical protein [Bacilli bacterium]